MSNLSNSSLVYPTGAALIRLWRRPGIGLFGILCALAMAMAGFGGNAQPPLQAPEPDTVGPVTNLTATTAGQADGSVRLTWSQAANAQVHFVMYARSDEASAGNYANARMAPFAGTEGVIDGLDGGASYSFIVIGMRWNWVDYGAVWGPWSSWVSATPAGSAATVQPETTAAEPDTVGMPANLTASADGQEPGTVRLTWSQAENAQVHFVVYVESDEASARNYVNARMAPFTGTEGVIDGLDGGTSYSFIVIGMRWNWVDYGAVWGPWSNWVSATPAARLADAGTDRAALIAFYNATNGANWTRNDNWLSAAPIGEWHGVTTDAGGRVIRIVLLFNRLNGELPRELGNLSNLTQLWLYNNQLRGPIPRELGSLSNLTILMLDRNQFSGEIPHELGNLSSLAELRLHFNQLSGPIPGELGNLSNLTQLWLHTNQLSGEIPHELGNLSNLTQLRLHTNQLSGKIPRELGNLSNLDNLFLSGNNLTGCVPAGLRDVPDNDFNRLDLPFCADSAAPGDEAVTAIAFGYQSWNSAKIQSRIAQYIVEEGYGYPTTTMDGSTRNLIASLRNGDIDVLMELWLPRQRDLWGQALSEGSALSLGESLGRHWQSAFVIPAYLQEQHPGLDHVEDLKNPQYRGLFTTATSGGKARLVSCVQGWQCEADNAAQVQGYGLSDHVEIYNPPSNHALDDDLLNAYANRQPWLGYQWASNEPTARLELVRLSEPPYSHACWSTTKACAYEEDLILVAANTELPNSAPDVVAMLRKWDFSVDTVYKDIARWRLANPDADINTTALWWLNNHSSVWSRWVTGGAATSIQAALNAGEIPDGWE